jgi:hypothetical protein
MRRYRITGVLVGMLLAGAWPLTGQTVRGAVTDRASGKPLGGATLSLVTRQGASLATASTDAAGAFALRAPGPGTYRLQVQQPGFRLLVTPPFQLHPGEVLDYALQLTPVPPTALDTATVRGEIVPRYLADFYRRKQGGFGKFVTREEFERYNPVMVTDVMRHVQAFDITVNPNRRVGGDTRTLFINSRRGVGQPYGPLAGDCPPLVFVDGTLVGNARDVDVDEVIPINGVGAMEFYEGGVQVPFAFMANGSNCGAIAVWSRMDDGGIAQGYHRIEVGGQVGGQWVSGGLRYGRLGAQASILLIGPVELYPAFNLLVPAWNGTVAPRTGHQVTLALRVRVPTPGAPWYLGAGVTTQDVKEQASFGGSAVERDLSQQDVLLLCGATLPLTWVRPVLEVQLVDPIHPGRSQLHVFTGFSVRLH